MTTDTAPRDDRDGFLNIVSELSACSGTLMGIADAFRRAGPQDAVSKRLAEMMEETSQRIEGVLDQLMAERIGKQEGELHG